MMAVDVARARLVRLSFIIVAFVSGLSLFASDVVGQNSATLPGRSSMGPLNPDDPDAYHDVLVYGLLAKTPSELEFVDSVVLAVEQGKLPSKLVDQTYFWARQRSGTNLYGRPSRPIIYFIPGLEARIKRLKLDVELEGGLP